MKILKKVLSSALALIIACGVFSVMSFAAEAENNAVVLSGADTNGGNTPSNRKQGLSGDANLDGEVDITDSTTIQRYDVEIFELSDEALTLADVDRDGEVSVIDATWIQRWLVDLPAPEGVGEPVGDEPEPSSETEHKLLSGVKIYQKDFGTGEWELSQTTTIEYENDYPVLFDLLGAYEGAEHDRTSVAYTFDGDLPLTRTETDEAQDKRVTVDYSNGRMYNVKEEYISSGSYIKQMYQYGHGDDYFTMVLHDELRAGNEYNPDVHMEEVDSISITTENGLLKRTTNTGMYAYWSEKQEKKWIRFNGIYTAEYDTDGIVSLTTADFSSFGPQQQAKYEVKKEDGRITEILQYTSDGEGGWQTFTKYEFEYNDTEISAARFASMINYYITNKGGNYYIYNWY